MSAKENSGDDTQALGPSVVLGLVGAVVVLLLLGGGIWGVSKIVTKIRESREESQEEETEESESEDEEETSEESDEESEDSEEADEGEEEIDEEDAEEGTDEEDTEISEDSEEEESEKGLATVWVANDYKDGDITGDTYTVVWGDTLWEIAEGRYGSGFEWGKIKDANLDEIGYLPNGSRALIFPGQVLDLPE